MELLRVGIRDFIDLLREGLLRLLIKERRLSEDEGRGSDRRFGEGVGEVASGTRV